MWNEDNFAGSLQNFLQIFCSSEKRGQHTALVHCYFLVYYFVEWTWRLDFSKMNKSKQAQAGTHGRTLPPSPTPTPQADLTELTRK